MPKIVINTCFGGFSLSKQAEELYREYSGTGQEYCWKIKRDDEHLIRVVEELGSTAAAGSFAELSIVEIPEGIKWYIAEYDGVEAVHEVHHVWTPGVVRTVSED